MSQKESQKTVVKKQSDKTTKKSTGGDQKDAQDLESLRSQLLRISADFDNFRKRTEDEKVVMRQRAKIEILEKLLLILDNFSRAVGCAPGDSWAQGICQLFDNFIQEMSELGLRKMKVVGEKLDAERHEALMTESVDNPEKKDIVLEELQAGWEVDGIVIRPAKVKVGN